MTWKYKPASKVFGLHYNWPSGNPNPIGTEVGFNKVEFGREPIGQRNKKVNGKYLPGGDWFAYQSYASYDGDSVDVVRPYFGIAYKGVIRYFPDQNLVDLVNEYSTASWIANRIEELEGYGAEGYAKARPAQLSFGIATSVFELKDIPGQLKQLTHTLIGRILSKNPGLYYDFGRSGFYRVKDRSRLSHTAEWYMSINFGWMPILKDIVNFHNAYKTKSSYLDQLIRDAGQPVRRYRVLHKEAEEETLPPQVFTGPYVPNTSPLFVTQCYTGGAGAVECKRLMTRKLAFAAQFRYFLPQWEGLSTEHYRARLGRRLLGARVTPSQVWNMMPWTWLSDYFLTLGQAISNTGPGVEDQLIMDWGYITDRFDEQWQYQAYSGVCSDFNGAGSRAKSETVVGRKTRIRIKADPFAFRFKGGGPTLKQASILAALPLSRR